MKLLLPREKGNENRHQDIPREARPELLSATPTALATPLLSKTGVVHRRLSKVEAAKSLNQSVVRPLARTFLIGGHAGINPLHSISERVGFAAEGRNQDLLR